MRDLMQIYRSDNGRPLASTEFPEMFAVCRGSVPYLQFQILMLDQTGNLGNGSRCYTFIENDRLRNTNFVLENHEGNRRGEPAYMVGQMHAANSDRDHYEGSHQVRFEVRNIFLESQNIRLPVVFIDPRVLPRPKNLIVPLNAERREREDNHFIHMLQNEVLNPNNYSYRIPTPRDYDDMNDYRQFAFTRDRMIRMDDNDDNDLEPRRRRSRARLVGEVPHTPLVAAARPRGDESLIAAAGGGAGTQPPQLQPSIQLSRFTINAILNQAITEELTCPISMARIEKDSAAVTTCQHVFEKSSITRWLTDHDSCPVCRARTSVVAV